MPQNNRSLSQSTSYNILVTGVGAIIGYGIIKSLRETQYSLNIIGMDIYIDAVGQNWCDHFEQAVRADDLQYVPFILSLLKKYSIDLVIPGIEQDMRRMDSENKIFKGCNARFALNNHDLIVISDDKWLTYQKLLKVGLPYIKSYIQGTFDEIKQEIGLPMLVKPRHSYASKGICLVTTQNDFDYWKYKLGDNFMVQELVGTDQQEFTVAAFGYGDGRCTKKIIFRRVLSGEGATVKAVVVDEPLLAHRVDQLVEIFRPEGPTNFQFRLHKGEYLLLEINPRISASTSLRSAFGFNEARMCIEYYIENKRPDVSSIKTGRAVRYIEDYIVYDGHYI